LTRLKSVKKHCRGGTEKTEDTDGFSTSFPMLFVTQNKIKFFAWQQKTTFFSKKDCNLATGFLPLPSFLIFISISVYFLF